MVRINKIISKIIFQKGTFSEDKFFFLIFFIIIKKKHFTKKIKL